MKTFKRILIALLAIIVVLLVIAFILPRTYHVERSVSIKADKMQVFDLVSHLGKWDLWTVWNKKMDSTAVYTIKGTDGTIGVVRSWTGKVLGDGEMSIMGLNPGNEMDYNLAFNKGKYRSSGKFLFEPQGDSVKVTWTNDGDLGYNPFARYMGLFMGKMLGPDFEKGLANLKKLAEERAGWPKIEEKTMPQQVAMLIRDSAGPKDYSRVMGKAYGEMMGFAKSKKLKSTGAPFAIYLKWDSVTKFSVMDLGIPVEKMEKGAGRIRVETLPAQHIVMAYYFGPYNAKMANTYYILDQYIRESGKSAAGGPWEIYITDPMSEKDSTKWETDILFPVK
ncbi:MAG TPA: SRPBCC family protein [Bacteroidales bacterium]|nr:SRPBCC family protein [Bacteroidales bacterium]